MIDVKKTILRTLIDKFNKLRFLGDNNTIAFKKILQLIVLDDLYDWSNYLDDNQLVQKKLKDLRFQFIQCNPEFEICRTLEEYYVNVNMPYEGNIIPFQEDINTESIIPVEPEIQPDPAPEKCGEPTVVFFTGQLPDSATLTKCDKMNIYVNQNTGEAYFWNQNLERFIKISGDAPEVTVPDYKLFLDDESKIVLDNLNTQEIDFSIPITDSTPNINNQELNDVL